MKKTILALSLIAAGALNTAQAADTILKFVGTCDNALCRQNGADGSVPGTVTAQITLSDLTWEANGDLFEAYFTGAKDFFYQGPRYAVDATGSDLDEQHVTFFSRTASVNHITNFYIPFGIQGTLYFEGSSSSFAYGNYAGIPFLLKWKWESSTQAGQWTVASVPEPESYAMFLAGLGLMGVVARRRTRRN